MFIKPNDLSTNDCYIDPIRWILNNKEQSVTKFETPFPNIIIKTFSNVFVSDISVRRMDFTIKEQTSIFISKNNICLIHIQALNGNAPRNTLHASMSNELKVILH
jgi:hypothetical protein